MRHHATVDVKYKCQPHDGTPGEAMLGSASPTSSASGASTSIVAHQPASRRINQYRSASTSILAHGDMGSNSLCMNDLVP
jgi:hypothetical protein